MLVHTSVQQYSVDFELQLKRKNFSTPKNYLDFLQNYKNLLAQNRKTFTENAIRYEEGLEKLAQASEQVSVLQKDLEIKQIEVNKEKGEVEAILTEIKEKQELAGRKQIEANDKKKQLDIDQVQITIEKEKADKILEDAIPTLKAAEIALEKVDPKKIEFMKSLANPPAVIISVGKALMHFKPYGVENPDSGWPGIK